MYMDASEGEGELSREESEEEYVAKYDDPDHDACSSLHSDASRTVARGLSPVVEVSPEVASIGSTESLEKTCVDLESELNTAMSRLSSLTGELAQVEESVLESRQTKLTETVMITSVPEARSKLPTTEEDYNSGKKYCMLIGIYSSSRPYICSISFRR